VIDELVVRRVRVIEQLTTPAAPAPLGVDHAPMPDVAQAPSEAHRSRPEGDAA